MKMMLVWIGIALGAAVAVVLLKRSAARPVSVAHPPARAVEGTRVADRSRAAPAGVPAATSAPAALAPPALVAFRLQLADELPEDRRQALVATFKEIPRPPKLLHRLLSPDFVNEASSAQLVDMIAGEPLIAAQVLTTINSPMYGLKASVSSIGQAVTYLGLNTIRSICLRYILIASFKPDGPERKLRLDAVWNASALASELTQQISQRLGLEDRGSLVSAVVLSFLGRLATTASLSREQLAAIPAHGLFDRTVAEQASLGLCSAQIGRLLMQFWGLPRILVEDAAAIDSVMVLPNGAFEAERGSRLALCFVCARLGERLAEGSLGEPAAFNARASDDAELFHLQSYLARPPLARLLQIMQSPELGTSMQPMLSSLRR
jgi:HD-like signal output (HDOD) protein